jgi:hypothetical protein
MICPYCKKPAQWVNNKEKYGRQMGQSYMCYWCEKCDAYVGCHNNTRKPLGTMANKELRQWRMKAHAHIDPLWKSGQMKRGAMYAKLQKTFGFEVHIGESDIELCQKILAVSHEELLN